MSAHVGEMFWYITAVYAAWHIALIGDELKRMNDRNERRDKED